MIINELKLTNFCIYRGEHEFNLAPTVVRGKSKPVVLFGGMNGGSNRPFKPPFADIAPRRDHIRNYINSKIQVGSLLIGRSRSSLS